MHLLKCKDNIKWLDIYTTDHNIVGRPAPAHYENRNDLVSLCISDYLHLVFTSIYV